MNNYSGIDYILTGMYYTLLVVALPLIIIGFLVSLIIEAWHAVFS